MFDDILTIEEACEHMKMSRGTLAQLRYTGKGPRYLKPTPKTVLYKREWVDEWLGASERLGTSDQVAA